MKNKILLQNLNWNNSIKIQEATIEKLKKETNLNIFMQPIGPTLGKQVWENCALILCSKTDNELLPFIDGMFEWLQDMNWPGALLILERLQYFSKEKLKKSYLKNLNLAHKNSDKIWEENIQLIYSQDNELKSIINTSKQYVACKKIVSNLYK